MAHITVDDKIRYRLNTGADMDEDTEARLNEALAIPEEEIERKRIEYNLANANDHIAGAERALEHAHKQRTEDIREASAFGMSFREIAALVGLSHQRISQILR